MVWSLSFRCFLCSFIGFWALPIVKASKMSPMKALSPVEYNGLSVVDKRKAISKVRINMANRLKEPFSSAISKPTNAHLALNRFHPTYSFHRRRNNCP